MKGDKPAKEWNSVYIKLNDNDIKASIPISNIIVDFDETFKVCGIQLPYKYDLVKSE